MCTYNFTSASFYTAIMPGLRKCASRSLVKPQEHGGELQEGSDKSSHAACCLYVRHHTLRLQVAQSRSCLHTVGLKVGIICIAKAPCSCIVHACALKGLPYHYVGVYVYTKRLHGTFGYTWRPGEGLLTTRGRKLFGSRQRVSDRIATLEAH